MKSRTEKFDVTADLRTADLCSCRHLGSDGDHTTTTQCILIILFFVQLQIHNDLQMALIKKLEDRLDSLGTKPEVPVVQFSAAGNVDVVVESTLKDKDTGLAKVSYIQRATYYKNKGVT